MTNNIFFYSRWKTKINSSLSRTSQIS